MKTERMVVRKRGSPSYELRIGDVKIKQAQRFKYLCHVVTDDEKYDTEIQGQIGLAKDTFQKLYKLLQDNRMS